jgi:hypothetical protein
MLKVKVENMTSGRGNRIPNQFIIKTSEGYYFQSYDSVIAFKPNVGKTVLDARYWDYSRTTGKYRGMFLGEGKAETQRKINDGTYALGDLN